MIEFVTWSGGGCPHIGAKTKMLIHMSNLPSWELSHVYPYGCSHRELIIRIYIDEGKVELECMPLMYGAKRPHPKTAIHRSLIVT